MASENSGTNSSACAFAQEPQPEVHVVDHYEDSSRWSTFHRIDYQVRRSGRTWMPQAREFLDRGNAVALLPFCAETGHILLTRQFRMPIYLKHPEESLLVEVCGGILDDPDPATTARREAVEELGLELEQVEPVFAGYSTPGSVCEKVHFFIAPYRPDQRRHTGGGLAHEGEEIEILEISLAEAFQLIQTGAILDVRTIALVLYLVATGRLSPDAKQSSLGSPDSSC